MAEFRIPDTGLHILVLGCMSSGKSTVLNALLGRGVFPAGNRATTAQVFRIVHDPWSEENVCRNPSESEEWFPLTSERLSSYNGSMKENVPADIRLRFPFLNKKRTIVFYDTPGPNTSKYSDHRAETYFALEKLPLTNIFLVLDMVQLHTKDEEALLRDVGRVMKERGSVPLLVILNKADVIDVEKESVQEIMADVRDTVMKHLPEGTPVDVIPVMAKGAEVWRRMVDRDPLTTFEVEFGQYIDWRLCEAMLGAAILPEEIRVSVAEQMEEWRRLQKFSQAFKSTLEYLAARVHPEAELINKQVSKILDYADCRRAITGSGIIALEEYIDKLTVKRRRPAPEAMPAAEADPAAAKAVQAAPAERESKAKMPDRQQAMALLKEYNAEPFHILHALTVEGVMRWFAKDQGFADEAEHWGLVGLLHDIDFERWPEEHCKRAPEVLKQAGYDEGFIYSVCSHAYGLCSDCEPKHQMEKLLFAVDELTGLIGAAALMRPSKSVMDMEVSSLKKKFKDKRFAAGCSRDVIKEGAERLGWTLDELFTRTLEAMRSCEASVNAEMKALEA
ncbi:MAG: dynamin family protein [Mailhella sp.]|nr:dynamin family protein [Mailhella sp.]